MRLMFAASRSRVGLGRLMAAALIAICALCLVSAQRASAASWPFTETTSTLKYPYALGSNGAGIGAGVKDTACGRTNQCVSVGYIYDSLNNQQAYVGSIVDGAPKAGAQVSLPRTQRPNPGASLTYVGCQGVSTCTAVGLLHEPIVGPGSDRRPDQQRNPFRRGRGPSAWRCRRRAGVLPVPRMPVIGRLRGRRDLHQQHNEQERAMGCRVERTSATNVSVNQPSNYDTASPQGEFYGVACQASSPCEAVGYYEATSSAYSEPMAATINPGSSVTTVQVPLPSDAVSNDPAAP